MTRAPTRLPMNRRHESTLVEDFSRTPDNVSAPDPYQEETSIFKYGTKSCRLLEDSVNNVFVDYDFATPIKLTDGYVGILFYVPEGTTDTSFLLYLRDSNSWLADHYTTLVVTKVDGNRNTVDGDQRSGWNFARFSLADLNAGANGSFDPSVLLHGCRIRMNSATGAGDLVVDSLHFNVSTRPKFMIMVDDGHQSFIDLGLPLCRSAGFNVTHYITHNLIGTGSTIVESTIQDLYDEGDTIANHFDEHTSVLDFTDAQVTTKAQVMEDWLTARGMTRGLKHFAYPGGSFEVANTPALFESLGFKTARSIQATLHNKTAASVDNLYHLWAKGVNDTISAQDVVDSIDACIESGDSMGMYIHGLTTGDPVENSYFWDSTKFETVINHLKEKSDLGVIDIVTIDQWYDDLSPYLRQVVNE